MRMFKHILLVAALAALSCLPARAAGLEGFQGLSGELRIVGSEPGLVVVRELAALVTAANPKVTISVSACGTGIGVKRLKTGVAHMSLCDRSPEAFGLAAAKLTAVPFARDPVAFVVHPSNPVDGLSSEQLRAIFTGRIRQWAEVGGRSELLLPLFVEASEQENKPDIKGWTMTTSSQPAMRFTLSRNKETIGFVSLRDVDATLKPIAVDGRQPSLENFRQGTYAVHRTLRILCEENPTGLTKAFVELLLGEKGQDAVKAAGYWPLAGPPDVKSPLGVDTPEAFLAGM